MDDPMSGGIDRRTLVQEGGKCRAEILPIELREILGRKYGIAVIEDAELQTARAGVDNEDMHTPPPCQMDRSPMNRRFVRHSSGHEDSQSFYHEHSRLLRSDVRDVNVDRPVLGG